MATSQLKTEFPKIKKGNTYISSNNERMILVVLATETCELSDSIFSGTVLFTVNNAYYAVGDHNDSFDIDKFHRYTGDVILTQ